MSLPAQGTIRKIGEFQMVFNEQNNMSAVKWQPDQGAQAKSQRPAP
jgi:hypothetical protein